MRTYNIGGGAERDCEPRRLKQRQVAAETYQTRLAKLVVQRDLNVFLGPVAGWVVEARNASYDLSRCHSLAEVDSSDLIAHDKTLSDNSIIDRAHVASGGERGVEIAGQDDFQIVIRSHSFRGGDQVKSESGTHAHLVLVNRNASNQFTLCLDGRHE